MVKKFCLTFLTFLILCFVLPFPAHAQENLAVTFSATPLFSTADGLWFPGKSLSKTFAVENLSLEVVRLSVAAQTVQGVGDYYGLEITSGGESYFSGGLSGFLGGSAVSLGSLLVGQSREFVVQVTLLENAVVEASGSLVEFELEVGVFGEDVEEEEEEEEEEEGESQAEGSAGGDGSESGGGDSSSSEKPALTRVAIPAFEKLGGVLGGVTEGTLREEANNVSAQNGGADKKYTLLDKLLQNKPNFKLLVVEVLTLLGGAFYFIGKSGYLANLFSGFPRQT
ncbi:MAG: hypothetical protein ABH814_01535 [bacterium]